MPVALPLKLPVNQAALALSNPSLKAGDVVDARVVGQAQNGNTLISLLGKSFSVNLPQSALTNAQLQFIVQSTPQGLQLSHLPAGTPNAVTTGGATSPQATQQATITANLPQTPVANTPPPGTQPSAPPTPSNLAQASQPLPAQSAPSSNAAPPPTQPAPASTFSPGAVATARVVGPAPQGGTVVNLNNHEIVVPQQSSASPGSTVQVQIQQTQRGPQLTFLPSATTPTATTQSTTVTAAQNTTTPTAAVAAPSTPLTPPAALNQAVISALGNQSSFSSLISQVIGLNTHGDAVPDNVRNIAQRIEGQALNSKPGGVNAETLQNAVARSGIFLESSLLSGQTSLSNPIPGGDLKVLLLLFRGALTHWLGSGSSSGQPGQVPLPQGGSPRAHTPPTPLMTGDGTAEEAGQNLKALTEGALSRMRLLQVGSLPEQQAGAALARDLNLELPIIMGNYVGVLHLQIEEEDAKEKAAKDRAWKMRFALRLNSMGEVGADVSYLSGHLGATLWAAEPETAELLSAHLDELNEALEAVGLTVGRIQVRSSPPVETKSGPIGTHVDLGT